MKLNNWTLALAGAGVISWGAVAQAEEQAMSQVLTAVSSTTLSGYVDTSAIWKFGTSSGPISLPGRAFDGAGKINGFNLNVASLTLEKPLSEDQWAAGYGIQLLFGPDGVGYNVSANAPAASDFGIKQAYVSLRAPMGNGLDFKIGTWNTVIGYESFESYLNPNFSRSFGWQLETTQHTGLLASYQFSEAVSASAGLANTWIAGINARNTKSAGNLAAMGSITLTAPESWGALNGSALFAGIVHGGIVNVDATDAGNEVTSYYVGATIATPVEGLAFGAAFDYRDKGPRLTDDIHANTYAWAAAGYVTFALTEKLKIAARADYTKASGGTWFAASGSPLIDNFGGGPGTTQELGSLTFTADYALWANVITRAEFRWDHSFGSQDPYGTDNGLPGGDDDALSVAANIVYKF